MNRIVLALALLTASPAFAQTADHDPAPVEVKGHTMGETLNAYLSKEGRDPEINTCQSLTQNPKDKEAHKEAKKLKLTPQACQGLIAGMNGSRIQTNMNGSGSYCVGTLRCGATFEGTHLVKITMHVSEGFAATLPSLESKYGKPVATSTETLQNGYGAKFEVGRAMWNMPDGTVILATEDITFGSVIGYFRTTDVTFATKQEAARKETTAAKNPFDK